MRVNAPRKRSIHDGIVASPPNHVRAWLMQAGPRSVVPRQPQTMAPIPAAHCGITNTRNPEAVAEIC